MKSILSLLSSMLVLRLSLRCFDKYKETKALEYNFVAWGLLIASGAMLALSWVWR